MSWKSRFWISYCGSSNLSFRDPNYLRYVIKVPEKRFSLFQNGRRDRLYCLLGYKHSYSSFSDFNLGTCCNGISTCLHPPPPPAEAPPGYLYLREKHMQLENMQDHQQLCCHAWEWRRVPWPKNGHVHRYLESIYKPLNFRLQNHGIWADARFLKKHVDYGNCQGFNFIETFTGFRVNIDIVQFAHLQGFSAKHSVIPNWIFWVFHKVNMLSQHRTKSHIIRHSTAMAATAFRPECETRKLGWIQAMTSLAGLLTYTRGAILL